MFCVVVGQLNDLSPRDDAVQQINEQFFISLGSEQDLEPLIRHRIDITVLVSTLVNQDLSLQCDIQLGYLVCFLLLHNVDD